MRLEQEKQTSEQSLEQVRMKKAELELRQGQLKEQGFVVCKACVFVYLCMYCIYLNRSLGVYFL